MKLKTDSRFKHFESKEQIQMGLDLENSHSIMSLLRNNIYSNPIKSWVREIYSNAVDAHARIDSKEDIRITIEDNENETGYLFIVRDFGPSMDKDTIANVYAKMGKSDKRSGNNEMGGWGLGAKSPLAYTDHFWVETFTTEDNCNIYRKWVQYIDSTRIGAIGLLEEKFVNGSFKAGTRVSIPFETKDYRNVVDSLLLYLSYTNANYSLEGIPFESKRPAYRFYGKDWALGMHADYYWRGSNLSFKDRGIVVVGDIPYRIDFSSLYKFFEDNNLDFAIKDLLPTNATIEDDKEFFKNFLTALRVYEFQIELPIGTIDLSASREDLQYTRHTCVNMYKQMYKLFLQFCIEVKVNLIYRDNLPEACIHFQNDYGGFMKEVVIKHLKWHKEPISFSGSPSIFTSSYFAKKYKLDQTYGKTKKVIMKSSDCSDIDLGSNRYFIVKQDTEYSSYSKFVKFYLTEKNYAFTDYFVVVGDEAFPHLCTWVKDTFDIMKMSDLVSFYKDNYVRETSTNRADKGKFKTLVYAGCEPRDKADGIGKFFDYGEVDIDPEETYYYISRDDYETFSHPFIGYGSYLWKPLNTFLENRNINKSNLVYTTKVTRNYKGDNWINFIDYLKSEIKLHTPNLQTYINSLFIELICEQQFKLVSNLNTSLIERKDGLFSNLHREYIAVKKYVVDNEATGSLFNLINSSVRAINDSRNHWNSRQYNEQSILDNFKDYGEGIYKSFRPFEDYFNAYPMLNIFNRGYWDNRDMNLSLDDAISYINLMSKVDEEPIKEKEELESSSFSFSSLISRFD